MSNDLKLLDNYIRQNKADVAKDMQDDEYFEFLLAEQITKDFDLTNDQIKDGIMGGGNDGGVDAIYVFVNGLLIEEDTEAPAISDSIGIHVIVAQAKNTESYSEEVINKFVAFSEDAFNLEVELDSLSGVYMQDLLETVGRLRDLWSETYVRHNPKLTVDFYYGSRAKQKPNDNIKRKAKILKDKVSALFSDADCNVNFFGASELWSLVNIRPKSSFDLKLAEQPIQENNSKSLVALVKLSDFFEFMIDERRELAHHIFESNVRDYQGDSNTVNEQIRATLQEPQDEDFWWLNNGVTIVATKLSLSSKLQIHIENPQIVNGLQTSKEIYEYFSTMDNDPDTDFANESRNLLVCVIVTELDNVRDNIIRATNHQTPIPPESLKSTEKIHRDIEHHLKDEGIYYDRRKNHWKLQRKPIFQILTIKKLAQAVQSIVRYDPRTAKSNPSLIFKDGNREQYEKVFTTEYPIELYGFCAELMLRVEAILRSDLVPTDLNKRAVGQIKFHTLTHVVIRLTRIPKPAPFEIAKRQCKDIDDSFIAESARAVLSLFQDMDATNTVSKSEKFAKAVLDDAKRSLHQVQTTQAG